MKIIILLLLIPLLSGCVSEEERFLGKKKVKGIEDLYVKFYQEDKLDMVTPLYYEIVDEKDIVIMSKTHLMGTHDKYLDAETFFPGVYDSILFIANPLPDVWMMKDLKKMPLRKPEELFNILKSHDPRLIEM